ncbi:MAG: cyclodeaminase [Anaerolineae bacterium]
MKITILTETELRQSAGIDGAGLKVIEDAFTRLSAGKATMPPVLRVDIPENNGELDVKTAYLQGLDSFAVKLSSGFFNNNKLGLPSLSGMMILLSTITGFPEALLLDNGYLTEIRTGLAGALAAKCLAPQTIETAGVIGAGAQARAQMRGLRLVRDFKRLLVFSLEGMEQYVADMSAEFDIEVVAMEDPGELVRQSQVVVTTTPAKSPHLRAEWLHPGLHITAMGADAEGKQELHPETLGRADLLVCDRRSQSFRLGELHHGLEAGIISEDDHNIVELGEITSSRHPGRQNDEQITICDLTGTGVQDTAIALLAYRKAQEAGLGMQIES